MFSNIIQSEALFVFIMVVALAAIVMEIFIPSFGVIGIVGAYLFINALLAIPNIQNPATYILISLLLGLIVSLVFIKLMMGRGFASRFVLDTRLSNKSGLDAKKEDLSNLLGQEGIVVKPLRSTGTISIHDKEYDAMSYGEYLNKGTRVVVDRVEGSSIYCRPI